MKNSLLYLAFLLLMLYPLCYAGAEEEQSFPRPGNLSDILECAASNEVFWTTAIRANPYDPDAHRAMQKSGWYSAVALWIFNVDSKDVLDAIESARNQQPRSEVLEYARKCREAPNSWRG